MAQTCEQMRADTAREIAQLRADVATLKAQLGTNSDASEIKADMLELKKQFDAMRNVLATGKSKQGSITFSKEDYANALDAKIADTALETIVAFTKGEAYDEKPQYDDFQARFNGKKSLVLEGRR